MAAAATLFSMAACGSSNAAGNKSDSSSAASSGKIEVVAPSTVGFRAEDLGGSNVEVTNIMTKTNVEAHDYEPTSQDVAAWHCQGGRGQRRRLRPVSSRPPSRPRRVGHRAETAGISVEKATTRTSGSPPRYNNAADAITAAYQKADPSHKDDYAKPNKEWHAKEDHSFESKITRLPPRPGELAAVRRHRNPQAWQHWPTTSR